MPDQPPWEKYSAQEQGPWTKYASQDTAPAPLPAQTPAPAPTVTRVLGQAISGANPFSGILQTVRHPLDTIQGAWNSMGQERGKAADLFQRASTEPGMAKILPLVEGAGHGLAGVLPLIGPAAANIGEQIGGTDPEYDKYGNVTKSGNAPDIAGGSARALGTVGSMFALPAATKAAGRALETAARTPVKLALRLPGKTEAFGATPAKAVLEETGPLSVRPATIQRQATARIAQLGNELESRAATTTQPGSLAPARSVVAADIAKAGGRNSIAAPAELAPMQRFLTEPSPLFKGSTEYASGANTPISYQPTQSSILGPGGQPILGAPRVVRGPAPPLSVAEKQSALDLLGMRRQFNTDFVNNWNPAVNTKGALGTARRTYGAIGNELDRIIPGGKELDQRISSLIPAADRARLTALAADTPERALARIARPTGGMLPAIIGGHLGGPIGAGAGLLLSELPGSAPFMMSAGRGLYGAGRVIGSGILGRAMQAGPFLRRQQP